MAILSNRLIMLMVAWKVRECRSHQALQTSYASLVYERPRIHRTTNYLQKPIAKI